MFTNPARARYSACMPALLILSLTLLFAPAMAAAENAAMPPPSHVAAGAPGAAPDAEVLESAPNLNETLKAPDENSNIDVRSYQRKDGATVTEYSIHGKVYEIKVQPAGGLPAYYLYLNKEGHFERRRPGGKPMITPPSWILQKF